MNHCKPYNSVLKLFIVTFFLSTASTLFCPTEYMQVGREAGASPAPSTGALDRIKSFFRNNETMKNISDAAIKAVRTVKNSKAAFERYKLQGKLRDLYSLASMPREDGLYAEELSVPLKFVPREDELYPGELANATDVTKKSMSSSPHHRVFLGHTYDNTGYRKPSRAQIIDFREIDPTKSLEEQAARLSNTDASAVRDNAQDIAKGYAHWVTNYDETQHAYRGAQEIKKIILEKTGKKLEDLDPSLQEAISNLFPLDENLKPTRPSAAAAAE